MWPARGSCLWKAILNEPKSTFNVFESIGTRLGGELALEFGHKRLVVVIRIGTGQKIVAPGLHDGNLLRSNFPHDNFPHYRRFPHLPIQLLRNHLNLLDIRVVVRLLPYVTLVGFGLIEVELVDG